MAKTVIQRVRFKATPAALYRLYMDPEQHGAAGGSAVQLDPKVGGRFVAFGMLKGRFLLLEPDRLIVQTWRSTSWKRSDPDSILMLTFTKAPGGAEISLVHVRIPDHDYRGVQHGWPTYYWGPWKQYLAR